MIQAKLLRQLTVVIFLPVFYLGINILPTWSQRDKRPDLSKPLLSGAKCTWSTSDHVNSSLRSDASVDVSIAHQLYTAPMHMYTYKNDFIMLTCKADPQKFSTLNLEMGVSDNDAADNPVMTVNIYQGGNKKYTYGNTVPGSFITNTLNLQSREDKNPGNIAIEMLCQATNHRCILYFLQAQLLPTHNTKSSKLSWQSEKKQRVQNQHRNNRAYLSVKIE